MRLLVVAAPGEARTRYEAELAALGVAHDTAASLIGLRDELVRQAYNGLLLDMPTLLRAPAAERTLAEDLLELFPALKMSYDRDMDVVHSMSYGPRGRTRHSIGSFVATEAAAFPARTLRRRRRLDLASCATLERPGHAAERAVIVNLSLDGCFVITTGQWTQGQELALIPTDLGDESPMAARCRRVAPWGPGLRLPGIGISFETMSSTQRDRLEALMGQEETA